MKPPDPKPRLATSQPADRIEATCNRRWLSWFGRTVFGLTAPHPDRSGTHRLPQIAQTLAANVPDCPANLWRDDILAGSAARAGIPAVHRLEGTAGLFVDIGANAGQSARSFRVFNKSLDIHFVRAESTDGIGSAIHAPLAGPDISLSDARSRRRLRAERRFMFRTGD